MLLSYLFFNSFLLCQSFHKMGTYVEFQAFNFRVTKVGTQLLVNVDFLLYFCLFSILKPFKAFYRGFYIDVIHKS